MSKRKENGNTNIHKFKKKKLNNMMHDPSQQQCVKELETLISNKSTWTHNDVRKLFIILCDNFKVAAIYGFQIEKALLDFTDAALSYNDVRLSSMCMSCFSNIKKNNGTLIIQSMLHHMVKFGRQFFEFLEVPTNLNDIKFTFPEGRDIYPDEIIDDDNKARKLVNRFHLATNTIELMYDGLCDGQFILPYSELMTAALAILSEAPATLVASSQHELRQTIYVVHSAVLKLLSRLTKVHSLKSCSFGFIPSIIEIVNTGLNESHCAVSAWSINYLQHLVDYILLVAQQDGAAVLKIMVNLVQPLVKSILSCPNDNIAITCMNVVREIIVHKNHPSVKKCVSTLSPLFRRLIAFLHYKTRRIGIEYETASDNLLECIDLYVLEKAVEESEDSGYANEEDESEDVCEGVETAEVDAAVIVNQPVDVVMEDVEDAIDVTKTDTNTVLESAAEEMVLESADEEMVLETMADEAVVEEPVENIIEKSLTVEEMLKSFVPF